MSILLLLNTGSEEEIFKYYIKDTFLENEEIDVAYTPLNPKIKAAECLDFISNLFQDTDEPDYILVASMPFFKALTGIPKAASYIGYALPSKLVKSTILYLPPISLLRRNPYVALGQQDWSMMSLLAHKNGTYKDPGVDVIHSAYYPQTEIDIANAVDDLLKYPQLTCDIESESLLFYEAGLSTITFCWDKHNGISFPIDIGTSDVDSETVRKILKEFFEDYEGELIFHHAPYDVTVLIYELFMEGIGDYEGILTGLDVFKNIVDTKVISYLATNTCAGNQLGLKAQAIEFIGNYALDEDAIIDLESIPLEDVLEYNLKDGLATWYVYEKNYPKMIADNQMRVYQEIFQPALIDVIQMQLTGLPLDMDKVHQLHSMLLKVTEEAKNTVLNSKFVADTQYELSLRWAEKRNSELKVKRVTYEDYPEDFNIASDAQLRVLLFEVIGLPILGTTKTGLPTAGKEVIEDLINHTDNPEVIELLEAIKEYKDAEKLNTSFLPRMLSSPTDSKGNHFLFGNFNLGGTVSGRLSSSNVNLQNLPSSGSKYAKAFKECFVAPEGYIFAGLDFDSLEDKISAVTTKDPNKLKIYTDGFDGHSYRAYHYWPYKFKDIDPDSVDSINSIKDLYEEERGDSKTPTFLLTYGGTYLGLIQKCGFTTEEAKEIEKRYHELYVVSDEWVQEQLKEGYEKGYVTVAFGLRVRTPMLKQVIPNTRSTPKEARDEAKTAGNALGQSWCMLNSRAASEVMSKVRASEYRTSILPCAQIHDAQYYLVKEDIGALQFLNTNILKAVAWQEDPLIQHDEVKLSGSLGIFYPDWSIETTLPKEINSDIVNDLIEKQLKKNEERNK